MKEEMFDVVNDRDEVIGQDSRRRVHDSGRRHRAVHLLIFNTRGDLFLQKRSARKDTFPGAWDSSAAGHVDQGESYDAAAARELEEELGLVLPRPPARLFKIEAGPMTGAEFVWVYRGQAEGPFALCPDEIERGDWFSPAHIGRWIAAEPGDFADAFRLIWQIISARALL